MSLNQQYNQAAIWQRQKIVRNISCGINSASRIFATIENGRACIARFVNLFSFW